MSLISLSKHVNCPSLSWWEISILKNVLKNVWIVKFTDPVLEFAFQSWDSRSECRAPLCCRSTGGGYSGPPSAHSIRGQWEPSWLTSSSTSSIRPGTQRLDTAISLPCGLGAIQLTLVPCFSSSPSVHLLPSSASLFHDAANLWLPYLLLLHYSCFYIPATDDFPNS